MAGPRHDDDVNFRVLKVPGGRSIEGAKSGLDRAQDGGEGGEEGNLPQKLLGLQSTFDPRDQKVLCNPRSLWGTWMGSTHFLTKSTL